MASRPQLPPFPNLLNTTPERRWLELERQWNESVRILDQFHAIVHSGLIGQEYTLSGTAPVSATLDLTSITTTAVAETLARLLTDLSRSGIIKVRT